VRAELFNENRRMERQTEKMNLIVDFRNFANSLIKYSQQHVDRHLIYSTSLVNYNFSSYTKFYNNPHLEEYLHRKIIFRSSNFIWNDVINKTIFPAYCHLLSRWISKRLRNPQICLIIKIFRLCFKISRVLIFNNNMNTRGCIIFNVLLIVIYSDVIT
jgi:hypothetical protein